MIINHLKVVTKTKHLNSGYYKHTEVNNNNSARGIKMNMIKTLKNVAITTLIATLPYIPMTSAEAQESRRPQISPEEKTANDALASAMQKELLEMFVEPVERTYISSGKTPEILKSVQLLSKNIKRNGSEPVTLQELLDNKFENLEFVGLCLNEKDPFRPEVSIVYVDPTKLNVAGTNYEPQIISFRAGFTNQEIPNIIFAGPEVVHMRANIAKGLEDANKYNSIDDKLEKFTQTLDIQAGKVPGEQSRWTPRYENQMGFRTEAEMRNVLEQTRAVTITYEPHDPQVNITTGNDFKVTFELAGGSTVTKYAGSSPLRISLCGFE